MGRNPNTPRPRGSVLVAVVAVVSTIGAFGIARASTEFPHPESVTAESVAATIRAVRATAPGYIATPRSSEISRNGRSETGEDSGFASIPTFATDGVLIPQLDGSPLRVELPNASAAAAAEPVATGGVVFPASIGSANVAIPIDNGVQLLTVITSQFAPTSFRYGIHVQQGQHIELSGNGGVIVNRDASIAVRIAPAWARDARGKPVPTHYETDGKSLTQVVEHGTLLSFSYPITADPLYWWGGKKFYTAEEVWSGTIFASLAAMLPGGAFAAGIAGLALAICNKDGHGIWVYWTWTGQVWCTGP